MAIELGVAFDTKHGPIEVATQAIQGLEGRAPRVRRLPDFAGTNDCLQVIPDGLGWLAIVAALAKAFGSEFVKEAAKDFWTNRHKHRKTISDVANTPVLQLVNALRLAHSSGQSAVVAVPIK